MMNMCRKQLCILLSFCLVFSTGLFGFAEQTTPSESAANKLTVIDFGDDGTWNALGTMAPQFTQESTVAYDGKEKCAKVTGTTTNTTGFIDLTEFGFETDWLNYKSINIRYYTDDVNKVPAVYMATEQNWVVWDSTTDGSFRVKSGKYESKKPTATGWNTVTFNLSDDFTRNQTKSGSYQIGWNEIKYLQVRNHDPEQSWNEQSAPYTDLTGICIDSIWLEKKPTPTATPEPTATPTTTPGATAAPKLASDHKIDFSSENDWKAIGDVVQLEESTAMPYNGASRSAKLKHGATSNTTGFLDLEKIGFKTDWSNYESLSIRYYTSEVTRVPGMYISTAQNWITWNSTSDGSYLMKSGVNATKLPTTTGWHTVTYTFASDITRNQIATGSYQMDMDEVKYLKIPADQIQMYWQKDTAVDESVDGIYIDSIWLNEKPAPTATATATPTAKPTTAPTVDPNATPTPVPKLTKNTEIDFSSENDRKTVTVGHLTPSTEQPYTEGGTNVKVTGGTNNWDYFFDLEKMGFTTDWSNYGVLKIRYYTDDVTKVPAAYMATGKGWVNSSGRIINGNDELATGQASYRLNAGTYASAKPAKTGWNTVSYVLPTVDNTDFMLYPLNGTSFVNNIPYLLIAPNHNKDYWTGNVGTEASKIDSYDTKGIYIDKIWLEKKPDPTPTPEPTPTPTVDPNATPSPTPKLDKKTAINFASDNDRAIIGSSIYHIAMSTDKGYAGATKSAKISKGSSNTQGYIDLKKIGFETDWSNYEVLNIRYYASSAGQVPGIYLTSTNSNWVTSTGIDGTAGAYKLNSGVYAKKAPTKPGWYTVSYVLPNTDAASPDLGVYGTPDKISMSNIPYIMIPNHQLSQYWGSDVISVNITGMYIDKIWLDNTHPDFTFDQVYFPSSGTNDMPINGAMFKLKTDGKIERILEFVPECKKNGSAVTLSVSAGIGTDFTVHIGDALDYDTEYSITGTLKALDIYDREVSIPISYTFRTVKAGATMSRLMLMQNLEELSELPSGGEIKAVTTFSNTTSADEKYILNIAVYDKDGALLDINSRECTSVAGNMLNTCDVSVTRASYKDCSVRAWITDKDGVPVTSTFAGLGEGTDVPFAASAPSGTKSLSVTAKGNIDKISISGTETYAVDYIVVSLEGTNLKMPIYPSADGSYSVNIKPDDSVATGFYTINAVSLGNVSAKATNVAFIGNIDRAGIYSGISGAASSDAVKDVLTPFKQYLGYTDTEIENISIMLYENKTSYTDYVSMFTFANNGLEVVKKLNSTHWSTLYDLILPNAKLLTNNSDSWNKFAALDENQRNIKAQTLQKSLGSATIKTFRAALDDLMKESGDGSGKGDPPSTGNLKNNSGTTSVGTKNPTTDTPSTPDTDGGKYSFGDIENHWSRDYVENLYKLGIVSEAEDGNFRPDDFITREEFIKLIVTAARLSSASNDAGQFGDVDVNEWYARYVSIAVSCGIIDGYDNGNFGIGDNLSRQDAAVICWRALNRDYTNRDNSETFADDDSISDYAKDAVYELRKLGVIGGYDDNTFNPNGTLTRGEAAKIITVFMNIVRG